MLKQVATNNMEFRIVTYPGVMPNKYMISEYGDVISLQPSIFTPLYKYLIPGYPPIYILKRSTDYKGYLRVMIDSDPRCLGIASRRYIPIHRLVAWEFCANRDLSLTVDHLDRNKLNNHYSNLEWVPIEENNRRAYIDMATAGGYYKSEESLRKLCSLLSEADENLSTYDMCQLAGLNLTRKQAITLCCRIMSGELWRNISCDYDFSKMRARQHGNSNKNS